MAKKPAKKPLVRKPAPEKKQEAQIEVFPVTVDGVVTYRLRLADHGQSLIESDKSYSNKEALLETAKRFAGAKVVEVDA